MRDDGPWRVGSLRLLLFGLDPIDGVPLASAEYDWSFEVLAAFQPSCHYHGEVSAAYRIAIHLGGSSAFTRFDHVAEFAVCDVADSWRFTGRLRHGLLNGHRWNNVLAVRLIIEV